MGYYTLALHHRVGHPTNLENTWEGAGGLEVLELLQQDRDVVTAHSHQLKTISFFIDSNFILQLSAIDENTIKTILRWHEDFWNINEIEIVKIYFKLFV